MNWTKFVAVAADNLAKMSFHVDRDVALPDGGRAELVGSRTAFSWKGLVLLSKHVLVRAVEQATVRDLQDFFEEGFAYAKSVNRVPLMRGMQFGYMILPCLALSNPSQELIDYACAQPPKHFAIFECPVVIDVATGDLHYYRSTALWGAFYFSDMRRIVESCLAPALASAKK